MSQFEFQYPWAFALIFLFLICAKFCPARAMAIYFPHINRIFYKEKVKSRFLSILKWIGVVALIIAMSSPVLVTNFKDSKKRGRDIMLVIDSSDSMREMGFDINDPYKSKFDVVKEVVSEFIDKRKNDRIGLINFASVAFIASPLTFEKKFLKEIIKMQRLGIAGIRTAINDALLQAYKLLQKSKAKSKVVILLTDGMDNMSRISFEEIKDLISKSDIKLYTIGIGGYGDFDPQYLKALAKAGKGKFYWAANKKDLEKIYSEIDKLETSKIKAKSYKNVKYLYIYPLFIAILALLLYLYYRTSKGVV
ncbi:MAG: VWA domain-containing protein [Epsilonproteobacteria bacterium]|nr:VWA domain-containing protein [Campylobacterota bacterium]